VKEELFLETENMVTKLIKSVSIAIRDYIETELNQKLNH